MIRWTLLFLWACSSTPAPKKAAAVGTAGQGPNVILISLDTVRADRMGAYGGRAETPNMVKLAMEGARFETAIANFPETALSHWAMMTGVLPEVHGNVPGTGDSRYTGPTLAQRLQDAGYSTAAFIGGETLTDRSTGLSRGFDLYDDAYPWDRTDLKRPGDQVVSAAQGWMQAQKGPYFAFIHLFDAHFPYTPKPPWDTRYDPDYAGELTGSDDDLRPYRDGAKTPSEEDVAHILALYDGEISELDAIIGPVLQAAGPNTVVMVTSDHGESFSHDYWFNHRDGLWDGVVRVPWLVRGPGVKPGSQLMSPVELVDVAPTVLGLLGLPAFSDVHGVDHASALMGKSAQARGRPAHSITDPGRPVPQFAVRSEGSKLLIRSGVGVSYDLRKDPSESQPTPLADKLKIAAERTYQRRLQPVKDKWQGPKRAERAHGSEELKRLESLGYIDAVKGGDGAPGAGQAPR